MIILLFGPPGCGKGTQAAFISNRFQIPAISTGEMFRAECKAGTRLGRLACSILEQGGLVGDDIVNAMVSDRISRPDCASGFLLDGYPRTVAQAMYLCGLLTARGLPVPAVIHLDVPPRAIVTRLTARRQCPTCSRIYNLISQPPKTAGICDHDGDALVRRDDDREEVIRQRLQAYEELSDPVIDYYRDSGIRIDGTLAPEEVSLQIEHALGRRAANGM